MRQRQGGNDRSDTERLLDEGNPLKGVNRAAGKRDSGLHGASACPRRWWGSTRETQRTSNRKWGATNPQPRCGVNRRSREKRQGRNAMSAGGTAGPKECLHSGSGRIDGTRSRGTSGQCHGRRSSSRSSDRCEEPQPVASALKGTRRSRGSVSFVLYEWGRSSREDLEGPAGNGQGRGGRQEVQRLATATDVEMNRRQPLSLSRRP
jgi:hypothetical protein